MRFEFAETKQRALYVQLEQCGWMTMCVVLVGLFQLCGWGESNHTFIHKPQHTHTPSQTHIHIHKRPQ